MAGSSNSLINELTIRNVKIFEVPPNNGVPNHPYLPALLFQGCISSKAEATDIIEIYDSNGWIGAWQWTVFDYHHFHPSSHEVLSVLKGKGVLHLGGQEGPRVTVSQGDCLILPAGFGHKRLMTEDGFTVVGAYPRGQEDYEIIKADGEVDNSILKQIAFTNGDVDDPIYGVDGLLQHYWVDRRYR